MTNFLQSRARSGRTRASAHTETEPLSHRLQIGELARAADVTVETIRYYESRGLIATSHRRQSGYREFDADTVKQIAFIGRAQALGFSLAEVKELVLLRERAWAGDATAQLREAVASKLRGVDHRLGELRSLRKELASLIAACDAACAVDLTLSVRNGGDPGADCPLVEALDNSVPVIDARPEVSHAVSNSVGPSNPGRRARRQRSVPAKSSSVSRRKTQ
ncbi:MAG TPA: MerR family transcriptional regulator [Gemmatimonadaceae bacterium]